MYNKCRDTDGEWANIFLKDVCGGEAPTDMTSARFLYVDDDHVPELWMDYGYGYAGGEVFTAESGASDKVYISQGSARTSKTVIPFTNTSGTMQQ